MNLSLLKTKIYTRDRLRSWGLLVDDICCLCNTGVETHLHLFFECPISENVWQVLMMKNMAQGVPSKLGEVLEWFILNVEGKGLRCINL